MDDVLTTRPGVLGAWSGGRLIRFRQPLHEGQPLSLLRPAPPNSSPLTPPTHSAGAAERQLERCGVSAFDLLLLHNPDRTGYTSSDVWEGMAALRETGLTRAVGVAPGPANGFTLDLIDCFERFGTLIDWAMIILNPL